MAARDKVETTTASRAPMAVRGKAETRMGSRVLSAAKEEAAVAAAVATADGVMVLRVTLSCCVFLFHRYFYRSIKFGSALLSIII